MTEYEKNREKIVEALEAYRDTPPDDAARRFIDWLMKKSLRSAQNDPDEKKYHNLIVLRYISSTKRSKKTICDALHIGRACKTTHKGREMQCYEAVTDNAIDRLLVLAFGMDGINWDESQVENETADCQSSDTSVRMTCELVALKYAITMGLLVGMSRNIRENTELPVQIQSNMIDVIRTAQAQLVLNAVFDL